MAKMRYCEIPRDVSCTNSFTTLRLCKNKKSVPTFSTSLNLEDSDEPCPSPCQYESPTPPRAYVPQTPTTECWRKKKTSVTEALPSYESLKQNGDESVCPPAPAPPPPSCSGCNKSQSLPSNASLCGVDSVVLSALRISPEDYASQLTLLDLAVFKQIRPDELTSCAWNKRNKLDVAPNVVAFTRRFNHVSFWAVQEILNCVPVKLRAETLAHFIRIGKKLFELNNFHCLFAIISALQSASVYRLTKTWNQLNKKEKLTFDKLAQVFSDENNWRNLRVHVDSLKLPCIPYLGVFLTDLVYIDMAHPHTGGLEPEQRRLKMNNILRVITHLQQSEYDLPLLPHIQHHLKSIRYIEELQKFVEDDQYKLSLKLEPPSPAQSTSSSKESVVDMISASSGTVASLNLSPAKPPLRFHAPVSKFVPSHRKCRSLGTNFQFYRPQPEPRHLLDDSVLEVSSSSASSQQLSSTWVVQRHINPFNRDDSVVLQGCLRRMTILKEGKRPTMPLWKRYWVQLWASTLVFYPPKSFKGICRCERSDFKKEPCKMSPVQGCIVRLGDQPDVFFFRDPLKCNEYKFKALSPEYALQWYKFIQHTTQSFCSHDKTPTNLITFE